MECYASIYLTNTENNDEITNLITDVAEEKFDLGVENIEDHKNGFSIDLIGASSTEDGVNAILNELLAKGIKNTKAYVIGDEDPWCMLFHTTNDKVISDTYDPGIFLYIAECEEDELNAEMKSSKTLREAFEKGPSGYFQPHFDNWKNGLEECNTNQITGEMQAIVEQANEMMS
jgi:hypothetical protein